MAQSPSPFDPTVYYRFSNAAYAGVTISTGYKTSSPDIVFTPTGSRSSENWQIYLQSGRYLLRNYDYGGALQLGLSSPSRAVPALLPKSGDLGQQWVLNQYSDGTWGLKNGLAGNATMLGASAEISGRGVVSPGMNPSPDGSEKWIITVNLSAGKIVRSDMLDEIAGLVVSSCDTRMETLVRLSFPVASANPVSAAARC